MLGFTFSVGDDTTQMVYNLSQARQYKIGDTRYNNFGSYLCQAISILS